MKSENIIKPRKALNKAYLKIKPNRSSIELFKKNLITILDDINESESEEFHKNLVSDFLKNTYYSPGHFINTKGRNDLVIHNDKDAKSTVGVIIEAKKPTNKSEMIEVNNINKKALQELVLYFLRERVTLNNLEVKYLIASNINEWFIFDASIFEKYFAQNKTLVKKFIDFEESRLSGKTTDFFYKEIAEPCIAALTSEMPFTYFDIRDYDTALRNANKEDDNTLIALYKLLSPEHLLKLPFANDSNSLDKTFYSELLHIIGLTETKEGSKKLIERKKETERNQGSFIESAIIQLKSLDKLSRIDKVYNYGKDTNERLFNVSLELSITWINRILFLKLLEAQLIKYHKGEKSFSFLSIDKVQNFDDLNSLFFSVLACKQNERDTDVKKIFSIVPYLNSSLFEPTELEQSCFFISQLKDIKIPILTNTVIKDKTGKKKSGQLNTIEYLFEFLNAYDFSSEGSEDIQEENKTLINASVLGLIFEKINGYKDGSFFTPGFVTMYMCRETIRRATVQKFNEVKGWQCQNIIEVYNKIEDKKEANDIINSLKICDPAVGSGHFLVSSLNEIIAIKSDLKILFDQQGKSLKDYHIEVVNDELIVTDEDGKFFEYNPNNRESQRVQESLFHEKQTIIENCLFGVDINTNSVKICRLRLWIELLKNAYYKSGTNNELETLPNIDINIKCGNSLVSRHSLDIDIKKELKESKDLKKLKWNIDSYRNAVMSYRNAQSKDEKKDMEKLVSLIKSDFSNKAAANDKDFLNLRKNKDKLFELNNQMELFEKSKVEKLQRDKEIKDLNAAIVRLETKLSAVENSKFFENSFEWRFEFPEVLNDDGDFIGFDVIIGNPPYINANDLKKIVGDQEYEFYKAGYLTAKGTVDIYVYFIELGFSILKENGFFCYITPNRYLSANYAIALREYLISNFSFIEIGDFSNVKVFSEASTYPIVSMLKKTKMQVSYTFKSFTYIDEHNNFLIREFSSDLLTYLNDNILGFILSSKFEITKKIIESSEPLTKAGVINATSTAGEAEEFHSLINELNGFKLINTGTIDRYTNLWGIDALVDKKIKYLNPYLPMNIAHLGTNRYNLYSRPKIIFAKIALRTEAFFDNNGQFASINTNCMHTFNVSYNPYYVLGWLNSKLFQFIFECFFDGLKMSGGYLLYSAPNIKNMYIAKADAAFQNTIEDIIMEIMKLKNNDYTADISFYDNEIDHLFYKFYDLNDDEIQIVEAAFI